MSEMELTPDVFTADYVGEPGRRAFFLQSRSSAGTYTFAIEKQQVSALAEKLRELLVLVDTTDTVGETHVARDPALALSQPPEPEWHVGTIGLAYQEDSDRVLVFVQPVAEEGLGQGEQQDDELGSFSVRFSLRRDQVRAFVLHAGAVVEEGRAICQLCGLPMDPEGHRCPASNGHRLS